MNQWQVFSGVGGISGVLLAAVSASPIESGIPVILQPAERRSLAPEFTTEGTTKVAEIPGMVPALPNGAFF